MHHRRVETTKFFTADPLSFRFKDGRNVELRAAEGVVRSGRASLGSHPLAWAAPGDHAPNLLK